MGRHLVFSERKEIETMHCNGMSAVEIAAALNVHHSTIYNELRRGDTGSMDGNGNIGYSAEIAQQKILSNRHKSKRRTEGAK